MSRLWQFRAGLMRILIVNDDGINGPGLAVAEEIAAEVAGPDGEVWVVAPETERSGASHCISYVEPMRVTQLGPRRFHIAGNPADCAIAGICKIMTSRPDLVLSGVNRGHNVAEDAVYSGTVAGAKEAALQGIRAISMSQYYADHPDAPKDDPFAPARVSGADAVRQVLALPWRPDLFYNVNFPAKRPELMKGLKLAAQGRRVGGAFQVEAMTSPTRRDYFWLSHAGGNHSANPDSDAALCFDGWTTVTPMRPDLTDYEFLADASAALEAAQ